MGSNLHRTARVSISRARNGSSELIAGFWIWEVASLDEAIEWAKRCPNPHAEECHLEIRPFYEMEDFAEIATPEHVERRKALNAQLGNG